MIQSIPLNKLCASTRNVRRSSDDEADLRLKADIEARGLLQNLVVVARPKKRGQFEVVAGGRRLAALQALASEGKIEGGHEVGCFVLAEDGAAAAEEASLAENFQRLAMNPADECLAFQKLVDQGLASEAIARRFGLTVRFVEGRLRLAGLAPVVFEALGSGEISLDIAKAYAATPDRERQADVFGQVSRSYMGNHPDSIRRLMTQATISSSDRRALLVGEEAYVAAGGRVERDLFLDGEDSRWLDVALAERLALEKMELLAAEAASANSLAFVRPTLESWVGYSAAEGLRRVPLEPAPLSDEESRRAEALEAEIEEIGASLEEGDLDEEGRGKADERLRALARELDSILDKPPVIPAELRESLGTFLLLDRDGQPRLASDYYALDEGAPDAGPENDGADGGKEPARAGLSRRLVDELAMQRRDLLAIHVERDPGFALDLATFLMADRSLSGGGSGSSLRAPACSPPVAGFGTPGAAASIALAEARDALDRRWMEAPTVSGRFDAFRALPGEARLAWLGHAVARTLEASAHGEGERSCAFHDHLGALLAIDVARWWRPTGANYFDRAAKSFALDALEEVGGPALAGAHRKSRKAELAEACERVFAGNFIAEAEVKQKALSWVPGPMRFGSPASAAEDAVEAEEPNPGGGDSAPGCPPASGDAAEEIGEAA